MRVSQSWLAEHIGTELPGPDEIADAFVRVGLEVEDVHRGPRWPGRWWGEGAAVESSG